MKKLVLLSLLFIGLSSMAQDKEKQIVLTILDNQTKSWNNGEWVIISDHSS